MDWDTITRLEREGRLPASPPSVEDAIRLIKPPRHGVKVLYMDIETSPNIADVWGMYDQNVGLAQLRQSQRIIGFSYRWGQGPKARWVGENDVSTHLLLQAANLLYDQADIVVTYNGNSFDNKHLNAGWIKEGILPPSPYKSIDLYRVVSKNFRFPSKKLAYVAQQLIGDTKIQHSGHQLWRECLDPDVSDYIRRRAWQIMSRYCNQDVDLLQPLHEALVPWLTDVVNIAFMQGEVNGCPKCGGVNLAKRGFMYTATRKYQRYLCRDCGGWTKGNKAIGTFSQESAA